MNHMGLSTRTFSNFQHIVSSIGNEYAEELSLGNGCFVASEVKVNKDISKYQEKVKPISQLQMAY